MDKIDIWCYSCRKEVLVDISECESEPVCHYGGDDCSCCGRIYHAKCPVCGALIEEHKE